MSNKQQAPTVKTGKQQQPAVVSNKQPEPTPSAKKPQQPTSVTSKPQQQPTITKSKQQLPNLASASQQGRMCECTPALEKTPGVVKLRDYLKIPSVHPDVNYDQCVVFLTKQATALDLPVRVIETKPKKPVVIMTLEGQQPDLPSIMLNSHMDVVPVYEESWTHPPFEAEMTEDGWIFGRGSQDAKVLGIQHMEAVGEIKKAGVKLKRTVHVTFVPDEETDSAEGMGAFVNSPEFENMNIGFALDEGTASFETATITAFYDERSILQIVAKFGGETGHSSALSEETAAEKLHKFMCEVLRFREDELRKLEDGIPIGEVTSMNLTQLSGGVQINVMPEYLYAGFDVRLATDLSPIAFESQVKSWCKQAGPDVSYTVVNSSPKVQPTLTDETNPFWMAIKTAVEGMGLTIKEEVCPGATDARFLRGKGIPAIGFTPLLETPPLAHCHDEKVHADQLLRGKDIMKEVVQALGNVA